MGFSLADMFYGIRCPGVNMLIERDFSGFSNSLFIAQIWEKGGELCVVFAQPIPHMVPSCNVTIRSPYIISPALDGPYMRGTSSQFVVTIVVCSSATYGRTFIQAIHPSRVAYAVLKRHIRPICVWVRISGLIILYSHIFYIQRYLNNVPKQDFSNYFAHALYCFPIETDYFLSLC